MDLHKRKLHKSALTLMVILAAATLSNIFSVNGISVEKDLTLTETEKNVLVKVKPLLYRDFMKHDLYLIRWLRAQNFNPDNAEAMLRANLKWRKERKMDTILQENWSDMMRGFPAPINTYDKQGRPIGVFNVYQWDVQKCVQRGTCQRLMRYIDYLMENGTVQVFQRQAMGMNVTQWKILANANGFNVVQHACPIICIPLWIQFVQSLESNYPGWLDEFIIIEATPAVHVVLEAVRRFLSRATRSAITVFGPNKNRWLPYLDQKIAKNQRTSLYGGIRTLSSN